MGSKEVIDGRLTDKDGCLCRGAETRKEEECKEKGEKMHVEREKGRWMMDVDKEREEEFGE